MVSLIKMKQQTRKQSLGIKILGWIGILFLGYIGLAVVLYTLMLILELFAGVNMVDGDPLGNFGYLVGSGIVIYLVGTFIVYRPIKWIYNKIK